jgi:hypothetical protein
VVFNYNLASKATIQKESPEEIFIKLKKRKITHILVRYDLFHKWVQDNYSDSEKEVIRKFFKKHTSLIFFKNGYGLYRMENH